MLRGMRGGAYSWRTTSTRLFRGPSQVRGIQRTAREEPDVDDTCGNPGHREAVTAIFLVWSA